MSDAALTKYLRQSDDWTVCKSLIAGAKWRHTGGTKVVVGISDARLKVWESVAEAEGLSVGELRGKMMEEANE